MRASGPGPAPGPGPASEGAHGTQGLQRDPDQPLVDAEATKTEVVEIESGGVMGDPLLGSTAGGGAGAVLLGGLAAVLAPPFALAAAAAGGIAGAFAGGVLAKELARGVDIGDAMEFDQPGHGGQTSGQPGQTTAAGSDDVGRETEGQEGLADGITGAFGVRSGHGREEGLGGDGICKQELSEHEIGDVGGHKSEHHSHNK